MKNKSLNLLGIIFLFVVAGIAQANPVDKHLQTYQQQGVSQTDAAKGEQLWYASNNKRSCSSCHGAKPSDAGQHARTRKSIDPMAVSVNPGRYQDSKKVEKWFLRNCKWTFGRTCTVQEKANILTWLASQ